MWIETCAGAAGQQMRQALAHLGGGAAGEGDGEAVLGGDAALGDQMRDAVGQRAGLARARTGDDQQRPVDACAAARWS